MIPQNDFTVHIELKGPFITEFQSDTVFGHICWAIRYLYGDDKLTKFLAAYDDTKLPPLLVSNGIPEGYLPKPILPPVTQDDLNDLVKRDNRVADSYRIKVLKRLPFIPRDLFEHLQRREWTPLDLFRALNDRYPTTVDEEYAGVTIPVQHNTVNRVTNRVETGLYTQEETFYPTGGGKLDIFIRTPFFKTEELDAIFTVIGKGGFGKKKSTGKGHFEFTITPGSDLPQSPKPNGFVTLSSFIPTRNDPTDGWYAVLQKFGKLGGEFASSVTPFKVPLLMFAAGSTFRDPEFFNESIYGSLLPNVHRDDKRIRHYAYAFPLGINIGGPI
jgi:CRISPR-associated protein Csm4